MEDATDRLRNRIAVLETQATKLSELQAQHGVLTQSRLNHQREHVSVLIERTDHQEQGVYELKETMKEVISRVEALEHEVALMREINRESGVVLYEVLDTLQDLVRSEDYLEPAVFDGLLDRFRVVAARILPH